MIQGNSQLEEIFRCDHDGRNMGVGPNGLPPPDTDNIAGRIKQRAGPASRDVAGHASAAGDYGHAAALGHKGGATTVGRHGHAVAAAELSFAVATGDHSHAVALSQDSHA